MRKHLKLSLLQMIKKCKKLQKFGIEGCDDPLEGILEALPSQVNTLKDFKLQLDELENQSVLFSTISALVHLEKLNVNYCNFVTDAFLEVVGKYCKKLTYLNLYGEFCV